MKKILSLLLFAGLASAGSQAQSYLSSHDRFFLSYEVAIPSGFITKTSWVGGRFDYRRMITPNVSFGLGASWNSFDEYVPKTTYQKADGTGALTTDIVKEIYTVPVTAAVHYYFNAGNKVQPYIGLGLGAQYSDQTVYMNVFSLTAYNWGFVARPEVGIILPLSGNGGLYFSAAYNYATNKNDAFSIDHMQHIALNLGITFGAR